MASLTEKIEGTLSSFFGLWQSENGLSASQEDAAIRKAHDIESSASEIDGKATFNQNTLAIDGDSIAEQNDKGFNALGCASFGNILMNQKFNIIDNFGVGGERTDQILTRLSTTLETSAKYIHFIMGKNDVWQDKLYEDIITNMENIFDQTIKSGKIVIASTIIPSDSDTTAESLLINKLNAWIKQQQQTKQNYIVVDYYSAMVNPLTGLAYTSYTFDGGHPNAIGAYYMGLKFKESLENIPSINLFQLTNMADGFQIVPNSLMSGGTTLADGWHASGSSVRSKVVLEDGLEAQQIEHTTKIGSSFYDSITSGFSDGDTISALCEFETIDATEIDLLTISVNVVHSGGTDKVYGLFVNSAYKGYSQEVFSGVLKFNDYVLPAGTTEIIPNFYLDMQGIIQIKKFQIFNHGA